MNEQAGPVTGKILVVDDEKNIRRGLATILTRHGHDVQRAATAAEALTTLADSPAEVAIVDLRLPDRSGDELLQLIRERWPHVSVIMLTGHGSLQSAMTAVKAGAHDYLLKPAAPDVILETVAGALTTARRRRQRDQLLTTLRQSLQQLSDLPAQSTTATPPAPDEAAEQTRIRMADLEIDCAAHQVYKREQPISLTLSEYRLLVALASHAGQVLDYVSLVALTLDYEAEPWEAKELIKRHIFSLRQKIEDEPRYPSLILNVRGVGYRLASP